MKICAEFEPATCLRLMALSSYYPSPKGGLCIYVVNNLSSYRLLSSRNVRSICLPYSACISLLRLCLPDLINFLFAKTEHDSFEAHWNVATNGFVSNQRQVWHKFWAIYRSKVLQIVLWLVAFVNQQNGNVNIYKLINNARKVSGSRLKLCYLLYGFAIVDLFFFLFIFLIFFVICIPI